jgi:DNA-binding phage protein
MNASINHDDWLFAQLQDAAFAAEYLNAAGEDEDPATYLTALRKVVEARGGMAFIAEKTQLSHCIFLGHAAKKCSAWKVAM